MLAFPRSLSRQVACFRDRRHGTITAAAERHHSPSPSRQTDSSSPMSPRHYTPLPPPSTPPPLRTARLFSTRRKESASPKKTPAIKHASTKEGKESASTKETITRALEPLDAGSLPPCRHRAANASCAAAAARRYRHAAASRRRHRTAVAPDPPSWHDSGICRIAASSRSLRLPPTAPTMDRDTATAPPWPCPDGEARHSPLRSRALARGWRRSRPHDFAGEHRSAKRGRIRFGNGIDAAAHSRCSVLSSSPL